MCCSACSADGVSVRVCFPSDSVTLSPFISLTDQTLLATKPRSLSLFEKRIRSPSDTVMVS